MHTPEQRDSHDLCGAKKKNGEICRAFAGQGTDHPGVGRCKFHGGATPTHRQHAVTVEAKRRMVKLGMPLQARPAEALLNLLYMSSGHVAWLAQEVGALDDLASHEGKVIVELYDSERDRLRKVAEACVAAGIEEREVMFANRTAEAIGGAVMNAIKAVDGLTEKQRQQFGEVLRLELMRFEEPASEPELLPA